MSCFDFLWSWFVLKKKSRKHFVDDTQLLLTKETKFCTMKATKYWFNKLRKVQRNEMISHVRLWEQLILLKSTYHTNQNKDKMQFYQNSRDNVHINRKNNCKMKLPRSPEVKIMFKKKSKAGGSTLPDFKWCSQAIITTVVWD